jgi:hypothetical protein
MTESATSTEPVSQGLLDIVDSGSIVDTLDEHTGPTILVRGSDRDPAILRISHQVCCQFGHGNHDCLDFKPIEADTQGDCTHLTPHILDISNGGYRELM